jgi:hypothetical protein
MPTLFHITPASTRVTLDARHKASATFTVTNASGGRMRARANVVVTDASTRNWFRLGEEAEHEFDADGTTQYTVEIAVPPDAPAGRYTFRLDVVGVENPDEDYSEGPPVEVVVAGPVKERKPFPWWIILAVVGGVLLVGIILAIVLRPRMTIVPVVAGQPEATAVAMLEEAHFEPVVVPIPSDVITAGLAIKTRPSGNTQQRQGSRVILHTSTGPQPSVVTGFVWNDWNGNKTMDGQEPKLPNITVRVTGGQGETLTVETDAEGRYEATVSPGRITIDVDENDPDRPRGSWVSTENDPTRVDIPAASVYHEDFGFFYLG